IPPILENLAQYPYLSSWFPPDLASIQDMKSGAKQIRALGRLSYYLGYGAVKDAVAAKIKQVTDRDGAARMLDRHGINVDSGVNVFVVASLCGGTGSGMFLDLAYGLKKWFKYDGLTGEINGLFMLPGAFVGVSDRIKANAYAALKELNHHMGMGRAEGARFQAQYTSNPLDTVDESGSPFSFCYLIGDQNKVVDSARVTDLQEMIAQKIALE
ncbi:MAG: tubulin-like doman-containing protein, partial [Gemmataceae bacterium]